MPKPKIAKKSAAVRAAGKKAASRRDPVQKRLQGKGHSGMSSAEHRKRGQRKTPGVSAVSATARGILNSPSQKHRKATLKAVREAKGMSHTQLRRVNDLAKTIHKDIAQLKKLTAGRKSSHI